MYLLDQLRQQGKFPPPQTGQQPGVEQLEQSRLSSPTEVGNSKTMQNISKASSQQRTQQDITASSSTMSPSGTLYAEDNRPYSLTHTTSYPSIRPSSSLTASNIPEVKGITHVRKGKSVIDSTTRDVTLKAADTVVPAKTAEAQLTASPHATPSRIELYGMRPKYLLQLFARSRGQPGSE